MEAATTVSEKMMPREMDTTHRAMHTALGTTMQRTTAVTKPAVTILGVSTTTKTKTLMYLMPPPTSQVRSLQLKTMTPSQARSLRPPALLLSWMT